MQQRIIIILFYLCLLSGVKAQAPAGSNVQGLKIAYITRQLSLSTEEAQKFWPVYYTYFDELKRARQEQKEDVLAFEEAVLNIRKKYRNEFKKILVTDERANKALTADRDFNNMVRKELQNRVEQRRRLKQKNIE